MNAEVLQSQTVYQGHAFSVRKDRVRLAAGQVSDLDIVVHAGAVTLVPVDDEGNLWMVRQYRHATGRILLELPAGTLEPGEAPEACAERECREEIGMAPGRLERIGECFLAPGYSTEYMYFFLATGLRPAPLAGDSDEEISIERVSTGQLADLVGSGDLKDAKSLAALYLARARLEADK
ncbi:MAG TPA: NUDIX hydrolase [Anaerolineales bacterium]|nr:NUDIX hydrolase [Anaerolineales bacterium]